MSAPAWANGMHRLEAGIYVDSDGSLHLNPAERFKRPQTLRIAALCLAADAAAIHAFRYATPDSESSEADGDVLTEGVHGRS